MNHPFRMNSVAGQAITMKDLLFACLATFAVIPAIAFGIGSLIVLVFQDGWTLPVGVVLVRLSLTGLFAWIGIPIALVVASYAAKRGLIGWGFPSLAGALGGILIALIFLVLDGAFYTAAFPVLILALAIYGAAYGTLFWLSLRWLRSDILHSER